MQQIQNRCYESSNQIVVAAADGCVAALAAAHFVEERKAGLSVA